MTENKIPVTWETQEERKLRYPEMEIRLRAWLGLVLIGRMFLHGISILLGVESGIAVILAPVNLLICLGLYSACIRIQWKLAWIFFIFRAWELLRILMQTVPSLLYLSFWGDLWWVTTIVVMFLDLGFLAAVAFIPSVHRCLESRRIIHT